MARGSFIVLAIVFLGCLSAISIAEEEATKLGTVIGIDERIMEYFIKLIKKKHGKDISKDNRVLEKLRREVERAKRSLSSQHQVRVEIESLFDGVDFSEPLTRARFEELNNDLFRKTMSPVNKAMDDAGVQKNQIDEIVLVGRSTRIPKGVNPDEAVAFGAAVQGGILSGEGDTLVQNFGSSDLAIIGMQTLYFGEKLLAGKMYDIFRMENVRKPWMGSISRAYKTLKFCFNLWLACEGRLPTSDRLIYEVIYVVMDSLDFEYLDHLFSEGEFTRKIWAEIQVWLSITRDMSTIASGLKWIKEGYNGKGVKGKAVRLAFASTAYFIWNSRVFDRQIFPMASIVNKDQRDYL